MSCAICDRFLKTAAPLSSVASMTGPLVPIMRPARTSALYSAGSKAATVVDVVTRLRGVPRMLSCSEWLSAWPAC